MEVPPDYSSSQIPFGGFEQLYHNDSNFMGYDPNLFNPISQYEQAYMYYRYLSQQLEYKMKCIEYEKLCNKNRKVE